MDLALDLTPPPVVIWGAISRGIGAVFLITFCSLVAQVRAVAGRGGVVPVAGTLAAIERDFPTWKRFFYFPTLLWLSRSDAMLVALCAGGIAASAVAVVGGPWVPWAFAACYVCYLSLDRAMHLVFPWDCMLFEAGFWAIFLPATELLPELSAVEAPTPAVAWVYRLLVFRVIFGFGKHKFIGVTRQDFGFLKGFMVNQPLPTPFGWLSSKLPMSAMKLALVVMFLVEVPLPFAVFAPGVWSTAAAIAIILLMVAIQLTGNFGYFNVAMIVLTLSWCDTETALAFSFANFVAPDGPVHLHRLVLVHTLLALAAFPFNTFCAHTWMSWSPVLRVRPRALTWVLDIVRWLHPFRLAHAYGVFPPNSPPPVRMSPVTEVTLDGDVWRPLRHRHWQTEETSPPTFCAPHHNRLDQAIVYEGLGLNEASLYRNIIGRWDPYGHGGVSAPKAMLKMLVDGTLPRRFLHPDEPLGEPPVRARVRTYMLEPTSIAEMRATGRWWKKTLVGPHLPPLGRDEGFFEAPNAPPELWHPEDLVWLRRSRLGALMRKAARGADAHTLVREGAEGLSAADVEPFWEAIVPGPVALHRESWNGLRQSVEALRAAHGLAGVHRLARVEGRYAALLLARLEPLFLDRGIAPVFGKVHATLDAKSYFHLRMLASHIVGLGREAYDAVMAEPTRAREHLDGMTMRSAIVFRALFAYEDLVYQSQKLRLLDAFTKFSGRPKPTEAEKAAEAKRVAMLERLFGALELIEFLKGEFLGEEDVLDVPEQLPHFRISATAEVVREDG